MDTTYNPETMNVAERRAEAVSILAAGLLRTVRLARTRTSSADEKVSEHRESGLDLSGDLPLSAPDSGLRAFPYYPYEKAVEYARTECGKAIDTVGWYEARNKNTISQHDRSDA